MTAKIKCKHAERGGRYRYDELTFTKADGQVKLGGADSLQLVGHAFSSNDSRWLWLSFAGTDHGLGVDAAQWAAFAPETIPGYARA